MSQDTKLGLINEESDAYIDNKNNTSDDAVWVNINEPPHEPFQVLAKNNKYINDEAEETLQGTDVSDKDDNDSFIDDESLGYYTTDDEDNDDDF